MKIHLAVDAHGMPIRFFVTDATAADCSVAEELISNFSAEYLLADRGYDTDAVIQNALQVGMTPVITPKKNRKVLREYDKHIYKRRYLVENAFLRPKDGAVSRLVTLKMLHLLLRQSKLERVHIKRASKIKAKVKTEK